MVLLQAIMMTMGKRALQCQSPVEGKRQPATKRPQVEGGNWGIERPEARLGMGPKWCLQRACEKSMEKAADDGEVSMELVTYRRRMRSMLRQALLCSKDTDVVFEMGNGNRVVGAHCGMLCSASTYFKGMFEIGMVEDQNGVVRVPGWVGLGTLKGLLEWIYLGRPGEECKAADGRQLWVLSEMYELEGIKEWLLADGLDEGSLGAAFEFAMLPVEFSEHSEDLLQMCLQKASEKRSSIDKWSVRGLGRVAAEKLLEAYLGDTSKVGRIKEGFSFVDRWYRTNGGAESMGSRKTEVDQMIGKLDLCKLSFKTLIDIVKPSELVSFGELMEIYEKKGVREESSGNEYCVKEMFGSKGCGAGQFQSVQRIAVHGSGAEQRVTACDDVLCRLLVFNVQSGKCVMTVGSRGVGSGQFEYPNGVAFSNAGELYVSDFKQHRIQVFDCAGAYVREFGMRGSGEGQFKGPRGIAVTAGGDIVVVDGKNQRVQVFRKDGTFVREFGGKGSEPGMFNGQPGDVAVDGPGGRIAVIDFDNARVQVYEEGGEYLMSIGSRGSGAGQFQKPFGVAFGREGEMYVSDWERQDIQVFTREGVYKQRICAGKQSDVDLYGVHGVAADGDGRLFVGCKTIGQVQMLG